MSTDRQTLLVTGGAGFIGANFVRQRLAQRSDERIVVLDALTYAGNRRNLAGIDPDRCEFVHGDIRDTELVERLLREHGIRTLVHFAAESHVDRSISGPDAFIDANVIGTHSLLKAARTVWLSGSGVPHRFHHVSTDEVYGSLGPHDPPFEETNQYQPNSPYSASKAASDHLVRAYHHTFHLEVTTTNCSNNYGPFQFPEKLIPLMLVNCLHGRPLPIYGDGMNIRDWLHVDDHCRGITLALEKGRPGEVYNIGGGERAAEHRDRAAHHRRDRRGLRRRSIARPALPVVARRRWPRVLVARHVCQGSSRPRPPLRDRPPQGAVGARLPPARDLRDGTGQDGRLVPGQRTVVARGDGWFVPRLARAPVRGAVAHGDG